MGLDGLRVKGLDGLPILSGARTAASSRKSTRGDTMVGSTHSPGVRVCGVCVCGVCVGICVYVCVRACVCVRVCVLGGGESEVVRRELTKECAEKVVSR